MNREEEDEVIFESGSVECERFVRWVRSSARKQGKSRDNDWTVDLAASALGGDALRWYCGLDSTVANDWISLQQALFSRYPASTSTTNNHPVPTPAPAAAAAAPPEPRGRALPVSEGRPRYGRIKVIGCPEAGRYISATLGTTWGNAVCCAHREGALVIKYVPSEVPHAIEVMSPVSDERRWLGGQQAKPRPIGKGLPGGVYAILMTGPERSVRSTTLRPVSSLPAHREVWNICELDGTIRMSWPKNDGQTLLLTQIAIFNYKDIFITGDYENAAHNRLGGKVDEPCEARLVFEPL